MSDVFLSYKHAQRQEARQLASALAARGWTVWWDWNIPIGANWKLKLDGELGAAGCVVVLWSADSVQSEWVLYEARFGLRSGKLVQALLEPVRPPPEFAALQAVDLARWEFGLPFHAGFDQLRAAIRELLDRRAPLAATRAGPWIRTSTEAGDVLRRDAGAGGVSRARPAPVMLLPPAFSDLLDRKSERSEILATLGERRSISLAGEPGSGKSALLCHVGNLDHTAGFHDGVVYLQAATLGESDLVQAVHEAFFDVAPGERPSAVEIRRNLADKTALLILDDAAQPPAGLDALYLSAPNSAWVFAAEQIAASARRRPVALKGLPMDDGIRLFERALFRPLAGDERAIAARIVESVQGHPARIEQAAGVAAVHGVAAASTAIAGGPNLDEQDSSSRRVLAALACGGGVALEPEQCAAIAEVDGINYVLAGLVRRGLAQHVPPGFRLAAGLAPRIETMPEFVACRQRATRAFTQYAFAARGTPRRVARLAAPMVAQMVWAAANGRPVESLQLARAFDGSLADANRWDAWRDMLSRAHDIATRIGDDASAGWAQHQRGSLELMLGDKRAARRLLNDARNARKRSGDAAGLNATGNNLRLLGWSRWAILLAVLAGLGVTTLGAIPIVNYVLRPIATVGPGNLDFGAQDVGAAAAPQAIQIGNQGHGTLELIDVTLQGPNAASFAIGRSCDGIKVPPKLACRLLVQFKPDTVGPHAATIVIRARDVGEALAVPIRGVGTSTPVAVLSVRTVDFGDVAIGSGATSSLTLRNEGSAPLTATAAAIEGDSDFRIVRDGCKAAAVAPEAQCAIELRFAPSKPAERRAKLVIEDNASGSPRTVALLGSGQATVRLDVAPGSLAFGRQEIGTASAPRPIRVRNSGTVPIEVRQVMRQGSDAFRVQDRCANARLAPGSDCVIDVRFAPSVIEPSSGRIVIASSAGVARSVELAGNGFGRPAIEVEPAEVDFGALKGGAGVKPRRVTITNSGSDAARLGAPRIDGDSRFSMTNGCAERLAPRVRCFVDISVDASGAGRLAARLVVPHNAAGAPANVPLVATIETPPVAPPPPPEAPLIVEFRAEPPLLKQPGATRLCFSARNAERAIIAPGGPQPSSADGGCVARRLSATTTFTLTVSRRGAGAQQRKATVRVLPTPTPPPEAPLIVEFRAEPPLLKQPGATQLCFSARNAERAVIAPGGPQPSSADGGCVARRLSATTTFTLTVSRKGAAAQQRDTTVTVAPRPMPPPPGAPQGGTTNGGSVVTKDAGVLKLKPGALDVTRLVGWCCRSGAVTRVPASQCAAPGQWFATEAPARQACGPPVIK